MFSFESKIRALNLFLEIHYNHIGNNHFPVFSLLNVIFQKHAYCEFQVCGKVGTKHFVKYKVPCYFECMMVYIVGHIILHRRVSHTLSMRIICIIYNVVGHIRQVITLNTYILIEYSHIGLINLVLYSIIDEQQAILIINEGISMPTIPYKSSKAGGSERNLLLSCTCFELTQNMCQSWVCQDARPISNP